VAEQRTGKRSPGPERDPAAGGLPFALIAVLVACAAAGFLVDMHPHFAIERLPAFHAIVGLVACAILVAAAKLLGALLGREEDFHDR